MSTTTLATTLAACAVLAPLPVPAADSDAPVRTLGTVTVIGTRPTSLPTQIPTTIESITADEIAEQVNTTDAEDALKYFPSLTVRKRYVGDYDHAVLASRASGTGNSARSLVYADGILLSNLLGNGASFTPRWGMVSPEEIERVAVLYGPFSAAYPGNSVGAVVDYVTRMPERLGGHARLASFGQDFSLHASDGTFSGHQASVSLGDRFGGWSFWINYNRLDSEGQPLVFANKLAGDAAAGGVPVTGALAGQNPRRQAWWLIGATSQTRTQQDHAKLKLAYDFTDTLRATYTLGYWHNDAVRRSQSYLRDAAGQPYYGELGSARNVTIDIEGHGYALTPSDLAPSRGALEHLIHGLAVRSSTGGTWDWELAGSLYDYATDESRAPTVFVADAGTRGAGRIASMAGTGWNTLALKGIWRPAAARGAHLVDFGYQRDAAQLRSRSFATADWIGGAPAGRVAEFRGETVLQSLYAQDTWSFADSWRATLGARFERWRARDGALGGPAPGLAAFAERDQAHVSPKLALAWQLAPGWSLQASLGRAVRLPTVSELYQGTLGVGGDIVNNDPGLAPERSWTGELSLTRQLARGSWRATAFHEDTRDALYSQVNVAAGGTVSTVQNVEHIRTGGLELAYRQPDALLAGLEINASLTYARSRIVANTNFPASVGKWQPRVPQWRGNLLATYYLAERWSFSVGARYSGRQYNTLDNSDPNGAAYTGTSNFFVVDARARYHLSERVSAALSLDNLNEEHYWAFHPYPQRTLAAELDVAF